MKPLLSSWFLVFALHGLGCTDSTVCDPDDVDCASSDDIADLEAAATTFAAPWTPAANTVYVHPIVHCSSQIAPTSGTGIVISNANVTLINPEVSGCADGISVRASGARILADSTKSGYGATSPKIHNNRRSIVFTTGASNDTIQGVNAGDQLFMIDAYRPITFEAGHHIVVQNANISHPASIAWTSSYNRSIVGIKALVDFSKLPASDRSFHDNIIQHNTVKDFNEEGISFDANGNTNLDSTVQGTGVAVAVGASANTVKLGSGWTNLSKAPGAWLSFNTGGAKGRYVQILGVSATTLTVSDPHHYLANAGATPEVSITSPYRNNAMLDNTVDEQGSFDAFDFTGPVFGCKMEGNVVTGTPARRYPSSFHLRQTSSGTALQSIRHTSLWDVPFGSMTSGSKHGIAAFNSVVGNQASYDISFDVRGATTQSGIPTYQSGNHSTSGQVFDDGSYVFLSTDPNP